VLLIACAAPAAAQPRYKLEAADVQTVSAAISYELRTTTFAATRWQVFLPEPPELPSQTKVKATFPPNAKPATDRSPIARKLRFLDVPVANPKAGSGLTVKFEVEATLRSRRMVELTADEKPPAVAAPTAAERKCYVSPSTRVDHTAKAFRDWLTAKKLIRGKGEGELDFAARVLEVIRADYTYFYDPDEDKRASVTCRRTKTDCGGMAYLFLAAMRANDVPARMLVGRLALPREPNATRYDLGYDRPHVRAEFYVADVGWVPIDPQQANTARQTPLSQLIGRDDGDLLVLHIDSELQLPYPDRVREATLLQTNPDFFAQGRGQFDVTFGPTGWELKATLIKK
jgi:transglutaminase-like putative cysteine protease